LLGQEQHIAGPLAQRRNIDINGIDSIKQIFADFFFHDSGAVHHGSLAERDLDPTLRKESERKRAPERRSRSDDPSEP
jgi:hypothetical protein